MAGAGIRIEVETDDAALQASLKRLTATVDDLRPVMDEIGRTLVTSVIGRFERERGPGGAPWKPSARGTRGKRGRGQTLTDTGRLRASITHRASRDAVEVGTNVIYAAIHQFGGGIERPARSQVLAFRARGGGFASRKSTRAQGGGGAGGLRANRSPYHRHARAAVSGARRGRPGIDPAHRFARHRKGGAMSAPAQAIQFRAVTAIVERLEGSGIYNEVLGVLDAAALGAWPRSPAAFVLPLSEDAADSVAPAVQATQQIMATIGVQTLLSAPNDRTGGRAHDELSEVLATSRAALAGWTPGGAREVLQFRRGFLIGIDGGRVEWRDEYRMRWWASSAGIAGDADKPARLRA